MKCTNRRLCTVFVILVGFTGLLAKDVSAQSPYGIEISSHFGDATDPKGPMIFAAPVGVCDVTFPERTDLPPDNPLVDHNDPSYPVAAIAYAEEHKIRLLQRLYCHPVLDPEIAARAKGPLPAACMQPPEAAAALDPVHPLADKERSDVIVAEHNFLAAVARVRELRAQCYEAATGTKLDRPLEPLLSF